MLDMDNPSDRQALVKGLSRYGLEARESDLGDGKGSVIVPLIDMAVGPPIVQGQNPEVEAYQIEAVESSPDNTFLHISAVGSPNGIKIGVLGYNQETDEDYSSKVWKEASTLDEAVAVFQGFWDQRDGFLNNFTGQVGQAEG